MTDVFILCSGQEDNIGDVVLRRHMLARLRRIGALHIYLGNASEDFCEGLEIDPSDQVYDQKKVWRRELWRSIRHGDAWLVDKPGELLLDGRHLVAQARVGIAAIAIRLRGGSVLRLGLGQRAPHRGSALLFRPLLSTSTFVAWRDPVSQKAFGIGEVMPDWGFAEVGHPAQGDRRRLVLSYRSDRPELSDGALEGIRAAAYRLGLEPIVVTQVRRDDPRSRSLAERLSCELLDWPEGRSHREQEVRLREVFADGAIVASDRLHVLIVAMTEGAIPLGLTEHEEEKIARHFEAVQLADVAMRVSVGDAEATCDAIVQASLRTAEVSRSLAFARVRLDALTQRVESHADVPLNEPNRD